jgi:hypothetical protein
VLVIEVAAQRAILSKQNFVWKNWPFLAALAGLNFQVQFSLPY